MAAPDWTGRPGETVWHDDEWWWWFDGGWTRDVVQPDTAFEPEDEP